MLLLFTSEMAPESCDHINRIKCTALTVSRFAAAFIVCRLDWCNSLLYGMPETTCCGKSRRCKTLLLVYSPAHGAVTDAVLRQLHWLSVHRRIRLHVSYTKLTAPTYLSADVRLISEHGRPHLGSSSYRTLVVPRTRSQLR